MASRPVWRGHLRLALVSCPVALHTATRSTGALRFHYINPKTGHRVRMMTLDAETDEELTRNELVKGYEFKKDHYLVVTKEDFDKARVESSTVMTVDKFVDAAAIDPVYYDSSYYLVPDGEAGEDVYVVLREAIRESGRLALSRITISGRERTVGILPLDKGLVVHTLHEARDLYAAADMFEDIPDAKPDSEMVKLATQLIDRQSGTYDPADVEDRYEQRLRAVIDAKLQGEALDGEDTDEPDRHNVIDLMAALKQSLGQKAQTEPAAAAAKGKAKRGTKKAPASRRSGGADAAEKPAAETTGQPARKPARKRA